MYIINEWKMLLTNQQCTIHVSYMTSYKNPNLKLPAQDNKSKGSFNYPTYLGA
jgi:hypothetical protein